jgi:hypothetical protein
MDESLTGKLEREIADLEESLARKKAELDRLKNEPSQTETHASQSRTISQDSENRSINNISSPEDKIALFRFLFRGRKICTPNALKAKKPARPGISRCAKTNGSGKSVKNLGSPAGSVPIALSSR